MIDRINLRAVRLVLFAVTVAVLAILTADRADGADTTTPVECRYGGAQIMADCVNWANVDWTKLDEDMTRARHDIAVRLANAKGVAYCGSVDGTWSPYTAAYDDTTETGGFCLVGGASDTTEADTTEAAPDTRTFQQRCLADPLRHIPYGDGAYDNYGGGACWGKLYAHPTAKLCYAWAEALGARGYYLHINHGSTINDGHCLAYEHEDNGRVNYQSVTMGAPA